MRLRFFAASVLLFTSMQVVHSQPRSVSGIAVNGHYFTDAKGKPFFWLGDTQWELFHQLPVTEAKALLLERKKQGFTVIQCMTTGVFQEWGIMKGLKRDTSNEAWLHDDPAHINELYFKKMDSVIAWAEEIGLILVIGVYHAQDVDHGRITFANARSWARWLAARYRNASNIIWSMYPHADTASSKILNEIIQGLKEGDESRHMVTVHPDPSPASSSFFSPASWLSFNTLQTWNSGYINYSMVMSDYSKTPVMPVVNGEARYEEEDGTTPADTRRAGYFSMLAGGFYSYGHQDNWRAATTWKSWYASPGARQMSIMVNLFKTLPWWNLQPDSTILVNRKPGVVAARSAIRNWLIVYLSTPGKIVISNQWLALIKEASATWVNPETGNTTNAIPGIDKDGISFVSPVWTDAVLMIKKGKLNLKKSK